MFTGNRVDHNRVRRRQVQPDIVARGVVEVLVDAQVPLRSREGRVAERELDLIQLGAALVRQLGVGAPQVVRRHVGHKVTKAERSAIMRDVASHPRPSRVNPDRCPCGLMTRARAEKRNHKCTAA